MMRKLVIGIIIALGVLSILPTEIHNEAEYIPPNLSPSFTTAEYIPPNL